MIENCIVIRRIKGGAKLIELTCVSLIAAFPCSRKVLNALYIKFSPSQRNSFHHEFAKIFRSIHIRGRNGNWNVVFADKNFLMPLTSDRFWLDWDIAVSIIGNDIEILETYEALINSSERPELFIDIGANYGTHSLLFLVHLIRTISFEPNPSCHDYFREICELNQVTPGLEPVALGEKTDYVELSYPARDTWLGSTNTEITKELALSQELVTEKVEQKILDDYLAQIGHSRTLIKIDTEGNELSVLRGATRTLQENKPKIIFESLHDCPRTELFNFLISKDYMIYHMPWDPSSKVLPLSSDRFMLSSSYNFIAIPRMN